MYTLRGKDKQTALSQVKLPFDIAHVCKNELCDCATSVNTYLLRKEQRLYSSRTGHSSTP